MLDHAAPVVISSQLAQPPGRGRPARRAGAGVADPRLRGALPGRVLDRRVVGDGRAARLLVGLPDGQQRDDPRRRRRPRRRDRRAALRTALARASDLRRGGAHRRRASRACRSASPSTSPTRPRAPPPPEELVARCARTLDRVGAERLRRACCQPSARTSTASGTAPTCGSTAAPTRSRTQQAVRWNLFQLAQATWRAEGAGVPAKGLTGQAYDGHYFWDTRDLRPARSSPTPSPGSPATCCGSGTACCRARASGRAS